MVRFIFLIFIFCGFVTDDCARGLEPEEVIVVVNERLDSSIELGKYYMSKREIPESHLVKVSLPTTETIDRSTYDSELKVKVQNKLVQLNNNNRFLQKPEIAAIVLMYGVPLKIIRSKDIDEAGANERWLEVQLDTLDPRQYKDLKGYNQARERIKRDFNTRTIETNRAAVDSELMLVKKGDYPLGGWIPNPYYLGNEGRRGLYGKDDVLLVSRLDGPTPQVVRRIIDDSLHAEKQGLQGIGYFDARGLVKDDKLQKTKGLGYERYDLSIKSAATAVESRLAIQLDDNKELFKVDGSPNAALYCGWYSLGKYIDSFKWVKGAIGYHIASAECTTLRTKGSTVWCYRMLEEGVAATIGPVYEPYVQGFPLPEIFFAMLIDGYMDLGEAYLVSLPVISWQMVLVGDPLYKPFSPR